MELSFNLISIILFYSFIGYLIFKNRSKIEFHKIYLLYKTKTGIKIIDKLSKNRLWKYWGYFGIPVGFLGMGWIIYELLKFGGNFQILIPGGSAGSAGPVMFIPIWTFLICISVIILVHEGAHGVVARAHKIKIKSTGIGLFTIIPLAFVEPDEKQLENASPRTQLSIFAAGPFANLCTGAIFAIMYFFLLMPAMGSLLDSNGLEIISVTNNLPASEAGIIPGDIILSLNGVATPTTTKFEEEILKVTPGDEIEMILENRVIKMNTLEHPTRENMAYIGVNFKSHLVPQSDTLLSRLLAKSMLYLSELFFWLIVLNIGIALVNLLPLGPVDGGRMLKTTFDKLIKNKSLSRSLWFIISMAALGLLILNLTSSMF